MRKEHDCLGEIELDDTIEYGIQTARALQNFQISNQHIYEYKELIDALIIIKKNAAKANCSVNALDHASAAAIVKACEKIKAEPYEQRFPLDIFQGGGGTSINMNANEVIAHIANKFFSPNTPIHPNTHVNMGQSTNDVIPSAMHLMCYFLLQKLENCLSAFETCLCRKQKEFSQTVKIGRTCLQDALPITVGQEFSGYASFVSRMKKQIPALKNNACSLSIGGTAIGTEFGTFPGYKKAFYKLISEELQTKVKAETNLFDAMQQSDFYIEISGCLKKIAVGTSKMATDLRILSSGPRAGFNEFILPAVQPGSSIMPGKINPVIPELVNQAAYQIIGNDTAINMAAEGGELDLNIWEPLIIKNIYESFNLLIKSINVFCEKCLKNLTVNKKKTENDAHSSLALSTAVAAVFGYEKGVFIAQYAHNNNLTIKQTVLKLNLLSSEQANELLDPLTMTDNIKYQKLLEKYKKILIPPK